MQFGAAMVVIQLKTVHHDPQPQRHRIGWPSKPLEPERRLGTPALLQNKLVENLGPGRLRAVDPTTDGVEQILLRGLAYHSRNSLIGQGGSEGCQGPCGCCHSICSSLLWTQSCRRFRSPLVAAVEPPGLATCGAILRAWWPYVLSGLAPPGAPRLPDH